MSFLTKGKTNWQYIFIVAAVAVVFGGIIMWKTNSAESYPIAPVVQNQQEAATNGQQNTAINPAVTANLSYDNAIKLYGSYRLQFDANCLVTPNSISLKKGRALMLDNRYEKARSVYLDDTRYDLAGYGFKIITLTTPEKLPHTISVDCGTGKNNGSIILQQ